MFGEAISQRQLTLMLTSLVSFEAVAKIAEKLSVRMGVVESDRREFGDTIASSLHATCVSIYSIMIALSPDGDIMNNFYGRSDRVMNLFSFSAGFFAWDVIIVLRQFLVKGELHLDFLIHGIVCFLCYFFGQFPFLNGYGLFFLMFEFSTPLLNFRRFLIHTGNNKSDFFKKIEMAFGIMFFLCRIAMGIPVSFLFLKDMYSLLVHHSHLVHNASIVYFYMISNSLMCGLNAYWFFFMVKKALRSSNNNNNKKIA